MAKELDFTPNIQPLFDEMKKRGIAISPNDTLYIELLNEYILVHDILNVIDLKKFNRLMIDFLTENKEKKYIDTAKRAKVLRDKVDWKELDNLYQKELKDWEKLLEDLL